MIKTERSRGILTAFPGDRVKLTRFHPSEALAPFVEHYWMVQWSLDGLPPFYSENLPHPSAHLVFEKDCSELVGVLKDKFRRRLEGNGHVFAVKFRPGGFYPFFRSPLATICNRRMHPSLHFGDRVYEVEKAVLAAGEAEEKIRLTEQFLLEQQPLPDPETVRIGQLLMSVIEDRSLVRVEQLAGLAGMNLRRLQRLFSTYVGVTPKWVIRRYRLVDAVERLKAEGEASLAALAFELGYADQAHFIRDFKKLIGETPGEYVKKLRLPNP